MGGTLGGWGQGGHDDLRPVGEACRGGVGVGVGGEGVSKRRIAVQYMCITCELDSLGMKSSRHTRTQTHFHHPPTSTLLLVPPVPLSRQVDVGDVVVFAAVAADASPAALFHQHLVPQGQVERQLDVGHTRQLLSLGHSPGEGGGGVL